MTVSGVDLRGASLRRSSSRLRRIDNPRSPEPSPLVERRAIASTRPGTGRIHDGSGDDRRHVGSAESERASARTATSFSFVDLRMKSVRERRSSKPTAGVGGGRTRERISAGDETCSATATDEGIIDITNHLEPSSVFSWRKSHLWRLRVIRTPPRRSRPPTRYAFAHPTEGPLGRNSRSRAIPAPLRGALAVHRLGNRRHSDVGVSLAADEAGPHEVPNEGFAAGGHARHPFRCSPSPTFSPTWPWRSVALRDPV